MKNIVLKTAAILCAIIQMFISLGIASFASSGESIDLDEDDIIDVDKGDSSEDSSTTLNLPTIEDPSELMYSISHPGGLTAGSIRITFDVPDAIDYSFEADGLTVVQNEIFPMVFDISADDEFGTFTVAAEKDSGEAVSKTLYTYSDDATIYVSEVSKDEAWHSCKQLEFDNNSLTTDAWHREYSQLTTSLTEEETDCNFVNTDEIDSAIADGNIVVRGRMTWKPNGNTSLPLRYTKVELRDQRIVASQFMAETFTDADGYYCFIIDPDEWITSVNPKLNLFVRVHSESSTLVVARPFIERFNYYDSPIINNVTANAGVVNISRRLIDNDTYSTYRLIYIQQGMVIGQRFALEMGMNPDKKLHVFHVKKTEIYDIDSNAFCYDTISFIGINFYKNFSATIHEYGHYVENRMGNYGSAVKGELYKMIPDEFNGLFQYISDFVAGFKEVTNNYQHEEYVNHFGDSTSKQFQMELTWSEAWATAFAKIAFEYYSGDYVGISYGDPTNYDKVNNIDVYGGEAQEYAVTSFLWDLYDGDPDPSDPSKNDDDNMNMSVEDWWDLTTVPGTYTLQHLSSNILENYPELINDVGEIFSSTKISPALQDGIISPCVDGSLILRWYVNGGAPYHNDKFTVVFYYEDNIILRIDGIDEDDVVTTDLALFDYIVPTEHWLTVMEQYEDGQEIYAVVYGYRSGEFDSGPYFSRKVKVRSANSVHLFNDQDYDNTYHWDTCACGVAASTKTKHDLSYSHTGSSSETHSISCNDCDYSSSANHQFTKYVKTSETYHRAICICGWERTQLHTGYRYGYSNSDTSNHYIYCACGHLVKTERHTMVFVVGRSKCRYCGYERTGSGQLIIMGKKKDEIDI